VIINLIFIIIYNEDAANIVDCGWLIVLYCIVSAVNYGYFLFQKIIMEGQLFAQKD
jgi:hypothetical protein